MKLIFAETHYWDSAPRVDSHHLARHMARRGHEILYLSSPVSLFHFLQRKNWKHKLRRAVDYSGCGRQIEPRLRAIVPFTWAPVTMRSSLAQVKRMLQWTTPRLSRIIQSLEFSNPSALVIQSPFFAYLPAMLPGVPVLYRMTDDMDVFPGMPPALKEAEKLLMEQAQVMTTCSEVLLRKAAALGATNVKLLAHGVDSDLFQQTDSEERTSDVLYVGAIDQWFDATMVAAAAKALPESQFNLVGPIGSSADLSPVSHLSNVHLLGPRQYEELPKLMNRHSVGIIPFKRTPLIEPVRPLKLFEYLAAGLNVVSTRWTELELFPSPAALVDNDVEFASAVKNAVQAKRNLAGIQFAQQNSWSQKAADLEKMLEGLL